MTVLVRETKETNIRVEVSLGAGPSAINTGLPYFDHMLTTFAKYAGLSLSLTAKGDLKHHLMEDVAISIGAAVSRIIPATAARYGDRFVPMDDALVHAAIDIGGRPFYQGKLPSRLYTHWMRSFCDNAKVTLHVRVLRGNDRHHIIEGAFKAVGLALRDALKDSGDVFSTKGAVALEVK